MKKFNIHDWQAKQRKQLLNEEFDPSVPNSQELTLAPEISKFIGQTFASWMSPSHPEFSKEYAKPQYIDKLVGGIMDIIEIRMMGGVNEMNTTGGGASFNAGDGMGYATPRAFKKKNKED